MQILAPNEKKQMQIKEKNVDAAIAILALNPGKKL